MQGLSTCPVTSSATRLSWSSWGGSPADRTLRFRVAVDAASLYWTNFDFPGFVMKGTPK
jgi:hypothetical protein